MDVTVAIGTFGDLEWARRARDRAAPSALAQGVQVVRSHGDTLHEARNAALELVETEWVVFLDADDELEPGFFDAMARIHGPLKESYGMPWLFAPSVRYVRPDGSEQEPWMPRVAGHTHDCDTHCLPYGNWLVIGTMVRARLVRDVGGFRDFPVFEDWDLWLRCFNAGAFAVPVPEAIYRAYVRYDSRNRRDTPEFRNEIHRQIAAANDPMVVGGGE